MGYSKAIQGYSGLWFKYKTDADGSKHLLVSYTKDGLESKNFNISSVTHDHYWYKNGMYYVQLRTSNQFVEVTDKKGHLLQNNSVFPMQHSNNMSKYLDNLFNFNIFGKLEKEHDINNSQHSIVSPTNTSSNKKLIKLSDIRVLDDNELIPTRLDLLQNGYSSFQEVLQTSSDPIMVDMSTYPYEIIDGRHRIHLARQQGIEELEILVQGESYSTLNKSNTIQPIINSNSMSKQQLKVQLQQLNQLGKFLQTFEQELQKNKQEYSKRLQALAQAGLAQEVEKNYAPNYAHPKLKAIDQLVNEIMTRDIPYVKKNIQAIQQAITAAGS